MLEDTTRLTEEFDEHPAHGLGNRTAQNIDRRPASGWNFLAWSFFLAQMVNSSAAQAAFEQFSKSIDPDLGADAPAKTSGGVAAGEGITAGNVPAGEEPVAAAEAADAAAASGATVAEVGGVDLSPTVQAGQVAALGEGAIAGGGYVGHGSNTTTVIDGPVHVIGVIIEIPGQNTTAPSEIPVGIELSVDPGVGPTIDVDVDVDGSGLGIDAGVGDLADLVLDVDLTEGISTTVGVSVLEAIDVGLEIGLSDGVDVGLDTGLGGLLDVAFDLDLDLDQEMTADVGLSLGGLVSSQLSLDLSDALNGGLEISIGDVAGVALDFSTANGLELDANLNLAGLADVGLHIGTPLSLEAGISIGAVADVELAFALDAVGSEILSPLTSILAGSTDSLLASDLLTLALADIGVAPDLGITLTDVSPISIVDDLISPIAEIAVEAEIASILSDSVPSLMATADEALLDLSDLDAGILGLELPLGAFDDVLEPGQSTDVHDFAPVVDRSINDSLVELGATSPLSVSSTIELVDVGSAALSLPLELISGGAYTDYGINLQTESTANEAPLFSELEEREEGGLLSSVDAILALDDEGGLDGLDNLAFIPDIGGDDGAVKGLSSFLL